jgi:hypothetical protein
MSNKQATLQTKAANVPFGDNAAAFSGAKEAPKAAASGFLRFTARKHG